MDVAELEQVTKHETAAGKLKILFLQLLARDIKQIGWEQYKKESPKIFYG